MNWPLFAIAWLLILVNFGIRHWLIKETNKMIDQPTEERIGRVSRLIYVSKIIMVFMIMAAVGILINLYQTFNP